MTSVLPSEQVYVRSAIVMGPLRPCVNQCVSKIVPDPQMRFAVVSSFAVNVPLARQGEFGDSWQVLSFPKASAVESEIGVPCVAAIALILMQANAKLVNRVAMKIFFMGTSF